MINIHYSRAVQGILKEGHKQFFLDCLFYKCANNRNKENSLFNGENFTKI